VDTRSDETERALEHATAAARSCDDGAPATYIPELANVDPNLTSAAISLMDGHVVQAGDWAIHRFTLQSSAKVALLAALLEDLGEDAVFRVAGKEPSGSGFAGIARLETHGPMPANPLVNAGAIALCGLLEGNLEDRLGWLEGWVERLYGVRLPVSQRVLASERRTGDRNRALAYLLRTNDVLRASVDDALEIYFTLCSYEASVDAVSRLAAVLANGGVAPGTGERLLSRRAASLVVALMATCGMYDESGAHLAETGLPAKSGVSGVILAVAPGRAGIAVASPRINHKGGSVRGHLILRQLAHDLGWHFASRAP
jgi:glutaminase